MFNYYGRSMRKEVVGARVAKLKLKLNYEVLLASCCAHIREYLMPSNASHFGSIVWV